nr:HipA domain-containing protein [Ectobacillus ponti]
MGIRDISHWEVDYEKSASGTREKHWMICPETKRRFLFKLPKSVIGEIWAEKVAAEIGKLLGLSTMETEIVRYHDKIGILLQNFVDHGKEEFYEGGDLLSVVVEEFNPHSLDGYTLDNIVLSLEPFGLQKEFIKICMFDAIIANQDRHCENWGIIQSKEGVRLAPIYDNGASLGFNVPEAKLQQYLQNETQFHGFTNRAKSIIETNGKRKPKLKLLLDALKDRYPDEVKLEIDRLSRLQLEDICNICMDISEEIMAPPYKEWVMKLIRHRINWLKDWYKGGQA